MTADDLTAKIEEALVHARKIDPLWRHEVLDLLRAARAFTIGMTDREAFASCYAWSEIDGAARTWASDIAAGKAIEPHTHLSCAILVYAWSLCVVVRDGELQ